MADASWALRSFDMPRAADILGDRMRKSLFLAALLAPALLATFARAADQALVTGVEKYLRDDEKAFLAAILTHPELSAEFDAEAPLALKDPKNLGPFLGVWRAKIETYAERDAKGANPNLDGHYANYAQLMSPEQRAYMIRRMATMKEDDRNSLIGYLNSVNDALAKNNGSLTWYTKKVVAGIMEHYRADLTTYVATPIAQTAKRDAEASASALAAIKKADEDSRRPVAPPAPTPPPVQVPDLPKPVVAAKPVPKPIPKPVPVAPKTPPAPPVPPNGAGTVASHSPAGGALDQLNNTVASGSAGGANFDGDTTGRSAVGAGAVITNPSGAPVSGLTPSGAGKPALAGSLPDVPSPAPADANFMDAIKKMQTKPAGEPVFKRLAPYVGGAGGALLGGLLGFLLGGPIGLIVGAVVGGGLGAVGAKLAANKLFQ